MGICFSGEKKHLHAQHQCQKKSQGESRQNSAAYLMNSEVSESAGYRSGSTPPFPPKNIKDLQLSPGYSNVDIFTYEEMKLATKQFRPDYILGEGGFGVVYKGVLDSKVRTGYKTTQVAIKELNPEGFQGDREWLAEVDYLGQLSHQNLVKLIGYCCEDDHRLLVYEYMANGSLEKHLFRKVGSTLTWPKRLKIALDAARGLAFLHDAERSIIYRDLKTSNILLDENFNAKLSDFGLAKDGPKGDQTHVSTRVMGTYGYAAPEYVMTGHLTARSDVYGFGVLLLEMLLGKRAMDKSRPSREHDLAEWARPLLNHNKKFLRIVDPRIDGQYSVKTIMKVSGLTYQCLSHNPKGRPLMNQVVEVLESLQELDGIREEALNHQSRGKSPTVSGAPPGSSSAEKKKKKSEEDEGRRRKPGTGPSKSEPENESDPYSRPAYADPVPI